MRRLPWVLGVLLAAACAAQPSGAPEVAPLPDLLGDEPSDGTASGMAAPVPPVVEPTAADRQFVEDLKKKERDAVAVEKLADMYAGGNKVERDLRQAAQYLRDAIKLGSVTASNKLGVLLASGGPGLLRDPAEAIERLKEGAKLGDAKAIYNLAQQYRSGELVERDEVKAFQMFKLAKDAPVAENKRIWDAWTNLGIMMMEGLGTARDAAGAVQLWKEAAAGDNVRACYFLGLAYARGQGVQKDVAEARKWLEKAHYREYPPAAVALQGLEKP